MSFNALDNYIIEIDGQTFELFEPFQWDKEDNGIFFDDSFQWVGDRTECDNYVFRFGDVWYYLKKGDENKVKLNRLQYIGKANLFDESLRFDAYIGVHGNFELMNGMHSYSDWVEKAKFLGIKALGICEKNTLASAFKFQNACLKSDIRPIFGMEVTVYNEQKDVRYTVKLIVKDKEGWNNLLKINKILNVDEKGFITEKELQEMKDGCFLLFDPKTCMFENLPILSRKWNDTYYQLDTVEYKKNDRDKKYLDNLKKFVGVYKPVAVCDAWYLERRYAPIREKLNRLAKVVNYESDNQYMKNYQEYYEELSRLVPDEDKFFELFEEALVNLNYISVNCNYLLETQVRHAPKYVMTEEEKKKYASNTEMFESLVFDGLAEHPEILEKYSEEELTERLNTEISIIEEGDVVDYFLMLRDIIRWGRDNDILVGLGRGCFLPDEKVYMFDNTEKSIKDVKVGDKVKQFYNDGNKTVANVFQYKIDEEIIELEFENGKTVKCTKDHKFFTRNRGWVKADELTEDDDIRDVQMCVYKAFNKVTKKYYIGKTTSGLEKRIISHRRDYERRKDTVPFYMDIKKYGEEAIEWSVIEYVNDYELLNEKEDYYINKFRKEYGDDRVYNIIKGGDGGDTYSYLSKERREEVSKIISESLKNGKRWSEESRKAYSENVRSARRYPYEIYKIDKTTGDIIKVYYSTVELAEDGFDSHKIREFENKFNSTYKGFNWFKIKKNETNKEKILSLYRECVRLRDK